jgi:hypothetical protein
MADKPRFEEVDSPVGGWGSAHTTASLLLHEHALLKGSGVLLHQNKPQVAGYYPECNPLIPLWHHAEGSFVLAAKAIPIRLQVSG